MQEGASPKPSIHVNHIVIIVATIVTVFATAVSIVMLRGPEGPVRASDETAEIGTGAGDACLATIDSETGEQTDPDCPSSEGSLTATIAQTHRLDSSCPPPTKKDRGGNCYLDGDVTLTQPLELASFTTLNCRGHRILPTSVGSGMAPSNPEVAVVLSEAYGVKLQDCEIGSADKRFDFGAVVLGGALSDELRADPGAAALLRNKILANTMYVRARGVQFFGSENNQVSDNRIDLSGTRAIGVHLHATDSTIVDGNTITMAPIGPLHRGVPGVNRQLGCTICGIGTFSPTQDFAVINIMIGTSLFQFPNTLEDKNDDNIVRKNNVTMPTGGTGVVAPIVVAVRSANTLVEENTVSGGTVGISMAGLPFNGFLVLPGTCSLDPSRYCAPNSVGAGITNECKLDLNGNGTADEQGSVCAVRSDCAALGGIQQSNGTCRVNGVDGRAIDSRVMYNTLNGPFTDSAIALVQQLRPVISGNTIQNTNAVGLTITAQALETGTITRNSVTASRGIVLSQATAQYFGALVSQNDVRAGTIAVDAGGATGGGICNQGAPRTCTNAADCDVNRCGDDGRCTQDVSIRCTADGDCAPTQCVRYSLPTELSVGSCSSDSSIACAANADCNVGHCKDEPSRSCRRDSECAMASGRTPGAGACVSIASKGTCSAQHGNFWGRTCEEGGFTAAETNSGLVIDSHPYGRSVATTPASQMPSTCR